MNRAVDRSRAGGATTALLGGMAAVLVGMAAFLAADTFAGTSLKTLLLLGAGVAVVTLATFSRRPRQILIFFWVIGLTYNRQFYSFDEIVGDFGFQGAYWMPADVFLGLLFVLWIAEATMHRRQTAPVSRTWMLMLPFLAVAALSTLLAGRVEWAMFELGRLVKLTLLLLYLSVRLDAEEWWTVVVALAAAVAAQFGLSLLKVMAGGGPSGIGSLIGVGGNTPAIEVDEEMHGRATGTMAHPNILAPYLLMLVPASLALALTAGRPWLRRAAVAVAFGGLATIVLSQSRLPIALAFVASAAVLSLLVVRRELPLLRAAGLAVTGLLALGILAGVGAERIHKRLTGNLTESVTFREQYNDVALAIWGDQPFLGIGPNNFLVELRHHAPQLAGINDELEKGRKVANIRASAPVHNLYLLILAEFGLFGLLAFLVPFFGAIVLGCRAVAATAPPARAVCLGLTVGLAVQAVQQTMDFSLWSDPLLFTFALLLVLLAKAPMLMPAAPPGAQPPRMP